jgi:ketosteroid isomerase-like protein
MTRTPTDVLEKLITGVTSRRWDDLPDLYAPDAVVDHPMQLPAPTRIDGRKGIAAHFAAAAQLPLEMRAENLVVHQTADPEVIVGEFDYVGRNTATGDDFSFANIFVLRVRDGRIVESRDYSNHAVLGAVFGGAREA